jgi:hypothetical protein
MAGNKNRKKAIEDVQREMMGDLWQLDYEALIERLESSDSVVRGTIF